MPRFSATQLSSGSTTELYTAPPLRKSTISMNVVNKGTTTSLINIAFAASGNLLASNVSPAAADYIEYNTAIPPGATLERTAITPSNGERLYGIANTNDINIVVWGFEEENYA